MAWVPSFVQVALDSTGKKIRNVLLTVGGDSVHQQVTAQADPEDAAAVGRVRSVLPAADDHGVVVRAARANFDTGLVTLPDADDEVTDLDTWMDGIFLSNLTTEPQTVTVKNDLGAYYLKDHPLKSKEVKFIPMGGVLSAGGIHWSAGAADAVNAQIVGMQG